MRSGRTVVLCLSHLRWNFVYQRPQHLLGRCAQDQTVLFFEEPIFDSDVVALEYTDTPEGVRVCTPHLQQGLSPREIDEALRTLVDRALSAAMPGELVLWFYTPMAVTFTDHLQPSAIVYDCMDELSLFHGAPPMLQTCEARLLRTADVVFTGGQTLYEHKRSQHHNIYPFPSSVDVPHFARARELIDDPADQAEIPHPRVGFFGVIDERTDLELLEQLADLRPDLQLVMIGPIVKIDPAMLPQRANLHWLGGRTYAELPAYISSWDAAMLPFARNDATRFISPTKTPEYLAAGKPVISTSIRDVVQPYGQEGLAWIADTAIEFSLAIDEALASDPQARTAQADAFLADLSWDHTWRRMWKHVDRVLNPRKQPMRSGSGAAASPIAIQEK